MLKFYGTSKSRSARCLWALEEVGVKYEHEPTPTTQAKSADHLRINPIGHVPVLDDNGTIIFESLAINLYLAEKYAKGTLWPASVEDHGQIYKWSFFGITELEPHLMTLLMHKLFLPADQRSDQSIKTATEALKAPLGVIDAALKGREYLLGSSFTIADLNVAAVLSFGLYIKFDFSATPALNAWFQKCTGREANVRTRTMK
ncbi:MAG TPA: glutathione S-transferase family protein [Candidatus Binataceae bacterium]|nr:glutathione S-transferase family protein [Candidatus Binataceae bacterium]